jgi:hypothetical protein
MTELELLKNKEFIKSLAKIKGLSFEDYIHDHLIEQKEENIDLCKKIETQNDRIAKLEKLLEQESKPLEERVRELEKKIGILQNSVGMIDRRTIPMARMGGKF